MLGTDVIGRIRRKFLPTEHELMMRKWWEDGGDYELRFSYDLDDESVVLDVGGFEGQWASDLFSRYRCRIFVFEPVSSYATRIETRFRLNDRIEVMHYGLGGSTRMETIRVLGDSSSTFGVSGLEEPIRIMDAADWFADSAVERIDLAKINIEGGEYELLDRLIETRLIERINDVQVQFHDIAPESRSNMERLRAGLSRSHRSTYQYDFVWENWRRMSDDAETK